MNKKILIPALAVSILGLALFAGQEVYAHGFGRNPEFTAQLAQKLGVSEDTVKGAFDSLRSEHQAQMQAAFEDRLNQAVAGGKITQEQKEKISAKHTEMQATREQNQENWQSKTPEERRTAMQQLHDDLTSWAQQNGIDPTYFFGGQKMRGMHGGWKK